MIQSSIGHPPAELRSGLSSEVHLWISKPRSWDRDTVERLLTAGELERARTLRHPIAQQNFLAGRALVRTVLSNYIDADPTTWSFEATRFGRPEITGPQPIPKLRFNLSHTKGLAACVVTATADCGVDVEETDRPLRPLRIAEHSFAKEEFEDLERRGATGLRERFFSYWTLKEAYYKARGSGIPFRLGGARFDLGERGAVAFEPSPDEGVEAAAWQFWLFRPTGEHLLAVALEAGAGTGLVPRGFESSAEGSPTQFSPRALVTERSTKGIAE